MKYNGEIRITEGINGTGHMKFYHFDLDFSNTVTSYNNDNSKSKITLHNGNFELCLAVGKPNFSAKCDICGKIWGNPSGKELIIKSWEYSDKQRICIGKGNDGKFDIMEFPLPIETPEDFNRMIEGLKKLQKIAFPNYKPPTTQTRLI